MTNKLTKELDKLNIAQNELYKEQNKTLNHIGNMTGSMQDVQKQFNQEMIKLQNPPQIQMPKINQNTQIINEEQKPHEYSNKKKVKIEIK